MPTKIAHLIKCYLPLFLVVLSFGAVAELVTEPGAVPVVVPNGAQLGAGLDELSEQTQSSVTADAFEEGSSNQKAEPSSRRRRRQLEVFSVLYSAETGRALVGLVDDFHAARFADCEAPTGRWHSSIVLSDLGRCWSVSGSAFMLTKENLRRLYKAMPGGLKRAFVDGLDPSGARSRALERTGMGVVAGAGSYSLAMIVLESVLDLTPMFSWRYLSKVGLSAGLLYAGFEAIMYAGMSWRESKRAGRFPALEGYATIAMGTKWYVSHETKLRLGEQVMPQIYEILRQTILNSVETLPSI